MESPTSPALDIQPFPLGRQTKVAIADIILLGAEIDHLTSMALFAFAGIEPHDGFVLIKRLQIGEKLDRLKYFVNAHGNAEFIAAFDQLVKQLATFTRIRNTLAHGVYMGMRKDTGDYYFQNTADYIVPPDDPGAVFVHRALGISDANLKLCAQNGRAIIHHLRVIFQVAPMQETYRQRPLASKPVSRKPRQKGTLSED